MALHGQFSGPVSEQKFSLSPALAAEVRAWARAHMEADPHGTGEHGDVYSVHSLYLDTAEFDVLRRNGSFGRGKFRIRRYGASDVVFLERKMKSRGLISKRRTAVPITELDRMDEPHPDRRWAGFWFHRRMLARDLFPVCQIHYSRTARMAPAENGTFRLTLDEGVSASLANGTSFAPARQVDFPGDRIILEMKFRGRTPALAQQLIDEFRLQPQPSSKYRIAGGLLGFSSDLLALNSALSSEAMSTAPAPVEEPQFA